MTGQGRKQYKTHHGYAEVKPSRYFALYITQVGWLMLGLYLYADAFWPSTCTPESLVEVYSCSMFLPENGGWREAALLTWLWATPILIVLEVLRRFHRTPE